jgi:hypothetical protein
MDLPNLYDKIVPTSFFGWFVCNFTTLYQLNTLFRVEWNYRFITKGELGLIEEVVAKPAFYCYFLGICLCSLHTLHEISKVFIVL